MNAEIPRHRLSQAPRLLHETTTARSQAAGKRTRDHVPTTMQAREPLQVALASQPEDRVRSRTYGQRHNRRRTRWVEQP